MTAPAFEPGERIPARIRRPCAAARLDPNPASGLKVPFARYGDGISRHVSAVSGISQGPFQCLDCCEALTLRQPRAKRRHFAHRPDSLCTGETALHRYAKELLTARATLTLPGLVLQEEGVIEIIFQAGTFSFERVEPEEAVDTFKPDALVTYQGVQLAVEFLVSHAVDDEKKTKVLRRDLSMVEIDLSGVRAGQMDGDALDEAILHSAPRRWIHHRRMAQGKRRLTEAVKAKKAERGARLRGHIMRRCRPNYPSDWKNDALESVRQAGLEALIGVESGCSHWFTVPSSVWQAHVLHEYVIAPSRMFSPGSRLRIKGDFPHEDDLSNKVPDWMIRTDLGNYPARRLAEAGFIRETYGSAHAAVWYYLSELSITGMAVEWRRHDERFYVAEALHGLLHRRVELRRIVEGLLRAAGVADPAIAYLRWAKTYPTSDSTPARLVENGGDDYRDLKQRLDALNWMVPTYSRKVVNDLCGLPLEAIRQRTIDAVADDEADRLAALAKAVADRKASIRRQAEQMLLQDAPTWLAQRVKDSELSFENYAGESDAALTQVKRRLSYDSDERQKRIANERRVADLRSELERQVRKAFKRPEEAELFLRSTQPRLQGQWPINYCTSQERLDFILTLMPKK